MKKRHSISKNYKMKRWSSLQAALYRIIDPQVGFQMHSNSYRIGIGCPVARYWITIGHDIVWDFPRDPIRQGTGQAYEEQQRGCLFWDGVHLVSHLIRDYVDTPAALLTTRQFNDPFGLIPLLNACDRRLGKRRLRALLENTNNETVKKIINSRLNTTKNEETTTNGGQLQ